MTMNGYAWVVVLGGVALVSVACAPTLASTWLAAPAPSVAPAPTAPPAAVPDEVPGPPPAEAPSVTVELCAELEPLAAREAQTPVKPATEVAERRASEALDRLAASVGMTSQRRGKVITLRSDDMIDPGQWTLVPTARYWLDQLAPALREQEGHRIVVQGYTDSLGTAALNDALSLRRAQAVCNYLVTRGVPVHALRIEGLGARRPVGDNATPNGRAQNRRIEIVIGR
jgi:outer membrane protein OmpA-like peptidoglycan-associated protein